MQLDADSTWRLPGKGVADWGPLYGAGANPGAPQPDRGDTLDPNYLPSSTMAAGQTFGALVSTGAAAPVNDDGSPLHLVSSGVSSTAYLNDARAFSALPYAVINGPDDVNWSGMRDLFVAGALTSVARAGLPTDPGRPAIMPPQADDDPPPFDQLAAPGSHGIVKAAFPSPTASRPFYADANVPDAAPAPGGSFPAYGQYDLQDNIRGNIFRVQPQPWDAALYLDTPAEG